MQDHEKKSYREYLRKMNTIEILDEFKIAKSQGNAMLIELCRQEIRSRGQKSGFLVESMAIKKPLETENPLKS